MTELKESTPIFDEAQTFFENALRDSQNKYGLDHEETVQNRNNLATLFAKQGRYKDAESLYLESLNTQEKILGVKNIKTVPTLNNLANIHES